MQCNPYPSLLIIASPTKDSEDEKEAKNDRIANKRHVRLYLSPVPQRNNKKPNSSIKITSATSISTVSTSNMRLVRQ